MAVREQAGEGQPPERASPERKGRPLVELGSASRHDAAEVHTARADAFAVPADQTLLDVFAVRRVGLDAALGQRLDEVDAAARRLGFMAGQQVGWAVLQAQPAVHALRQIGRGGLRTQTHMPSGTRLGMPARRPSPCAASGAGSTLFGLKLPDGSTDVRTRAMTSRSAGLKISGMYACFSMPTPCSPVIVPPASMHCVRISRPAAMTRSRMPASPASNRIIGCRLPSPA